MQAGNPSNASHVNESALDYEHRLDLENDASNAEAVLMDASSTNGISIDELPKQFYLLTHPRSASNLLVQILNLKGQPHLVTGEQRGGYYFMPLTDKMDEAKVWGKDIGTWTLEHRNKLRAVAEKCYADLAKDIAKLNSEPEHTIFVKEHCDFLWSPAEHTKSFYWSTWSAKSPKADDVKTEKWILDGGTKSEDNETLLSDEFLLRWMPTFLIRHPALAFSSYFRAAKDLGWGTDEHAEDDEGQAMQCSLSSSRKLYDFYDEKLPEKVKQYGGVDWPVVLTGDIVMTEPEVIKRYALLIRLDVDKLLFQWDPIPKEGVEKIGKNDARMLSTLIASTGIDKNKTSEAIDIDVEVQKWRKDFGDRAAENMECWVRAAMPDYEYLEARRLRAEPTVVDGRRV